MNIGMLRGQRLLYSAVGVAVVVFLFLSVFLYRVLDSAARTDVTSQTDATAHSVGLSLGNTLQDDEVLARAVSSQDGLASFVQGSASRAVVNQVQFATLNILRANQRVRGFYFFADDGSFVAGQIVDPTHKTFTQQGAPCDSTAVYCTITNLPTSGYLATDAMQRDVQRVLATGRHVQDVQAFDSQTSGFGNQYVVLPIPGKAKPAGVLVEQIDAQGIFGPYVGSGTSGNMFLSGNFVIGPDVESYFSHKQVPVLTTSGLNPSLYPGLTPVQVGFSLSGDHPTFSLNGTGLQGSYADVMIGAGAMAGMKVLNYAAPGGISGANSRVIFGVLLLFLALIASVVVLFFYLSRRVQRIDQDAALLMRAKSDSLTEDIVAVSQALAVAREGDLTVQVPDSESEVGLLSLSLNGLISDYGQIVGGIVRASHAVQEGAARVDEGVRRIVDVATSQAESVAMVAASVEEVATSAVEVQQGTEMATTLAANARVAVNSGQESVGRIAEAVDAIKEAAIGTTREFKRLQEDSIRLTALVASVKSNAENLDMQAANATLEARHLGTESGSAFATNIGRLARQAQDTLADAEGAVRSVVTSIDEVNRRIERISEQVRRGVDEVRTVRSTFEQITNTNGSLVQFIDNVAESAGVQAQSAQQAAHSIAEIAQVFEQFTELLITSGDEIANMRLIVAGLRESVADLKVEDTALLAEPSMGAESAA